MQQHSSGGTQGQTGMQGQGQYPISNHDYDLVQALASELKGLEAMQKYSKDAQGADSKLWQDATHLKRQLADLFTHELAEHAKEGHFGSGGKRTMH
jgi:hypothetical protein